MIVDVPSKVFTELQPNDPHPFVSESFIQLNKAKIDRLVRLVNQDKNSLGLVAGIRNRELLSPFSAPFGGFHYRHEQLYSSEIDHFVSGVIKFCNIHQLTSINLTLPPDIYHPTLNAKVNSALLRCGFRMQTPEITNWVDLSRFQNRFNFRSSREYYNQSVKNGLSFNIEDSNEGRAEIYAIVKENRIRLSRPIHMAFTDLEKVATLWPVDYFSVKAPDQTLVAGAIFYRAQSAITQAVFWGDSETGRTLRAMDFLLFNLWAHYKSKNYQYIDLGISTESGIPNEGLLRFKETHECTSSLRFSYTLNLS